ncbi:MAG TPA: SH3 domain-containing protein [Anaerolineales bacterium]|nr:SH3 domain-containing protein [Anaerolineales bacterium]
MLAPSSTPVVVTVIVQPPTQTAEPDLPPTLAPTDLPPTAGPTCTVQQNVNLRSGPGTAYDPPIATLTEGTELIPTAYNPVGIPGGSWVLVQVKGKNEQGWVSGGTQFVSCSVELASLPSAEAPPPPKPQRPVVSAGTPDGNNLDLFRTSLDFDPDYFLRMYVFYSEDPNEKFKAKNDGRDIDSVQFTITSPDGGKTYYDRTEKNAGYCIFGGGEPDCTPWIVEDGQYKWEQGGDPVKSGKYGLTITVTASNGEVGNWLWNSNSRNPIKIEVP